MEVNIEKKIYRPMQNLIDNFAIFCIFGGTPLLFGIVVICSGFRESGVWSLTSAIWTGVPFIFMFISAFAFFICPDKSNLPLVFVVLYICFFFLMFYGCNHGEYLTALPFNNQIDIYLSDNNLTKNINSNDKLTGKAIVIDKDSKAISSVYHKLSKTIKAQNPGEVHYVVLLDWQEELAGTYQYGSKGYVTNCTVEVIDINKKELIRKQIIYGKEIPKSKGTSGDIHMERPEKSVREYIKGLF